MSPAIAESGRSNGLSFLIRPKWPENVPRPLQINSCVISCFVRNYGCRRSDSHKRFNSSPDSRGLVNQKAQTFRFLV
jgi:hypothetical protein